MSENEFIRQGRAYIAERAFSKAIESFQLAIEKNPVDDKAVYFLGLSYLKADQLPMALLQFNRAMELAPQNATYLSDRAVTKLRLKDGQGAMKDLDRCVELDPNYSYRYSLRAFVKNSLGDSLSAIEDYKKALELDPEDAITLNNLGLCEEQMGYKTEAQRRFDEADALSRKKGGDHMMNLGSKESNLPTENMEAEPPESYWSTVKKVLTDKEEREAFLKFTGNLLKGNTGK